MELTNKENLKRHKAQIRGDVMACGIALKRPYEYDSFLTLGGDAPPEAKRTRTTCSPFRPQMGTLAASLPSGSSAKTVFDEKAGVFANAGLSCRLNANQIDSYLTAELRSLSRRKLIPKRCAIDASTARDEDELETKRRTTFSDSPTTPLYRAPGSPQSRDSSDSECDEIPNEAQRRVLTAVEGATSAVSDLRKRPMFSLAQICQIIQRLLSEQEQRLRFEYQQALEKKIAEHQEQYSQLVAEAKRPAEDYSCSYLS